MSQRVRKDDSPREPAGRTQWYIGAPNGVLVCVDTFDGVQSAGRFYHSYRETPVPFDGLLQLVERMEWLFDWLQFPHRGNNERTFLTRKHREEGPAGVQRGRQPERDRIVSDETLLGKHGELGTFIVRVQHRQNSSWQGRITWMEEDKTITFRSVWEMIKLMEDAITEGREEDEEARSVPEWFEGPKPEEPGRE